MWWWIADLIGAGVLIPGLVVSLRKLERPVAAIDRQLSRLIDDLNVVVGSLDGIPDLAETVMLTGAGKPSAERYGAALRASS